MSDQVIQDRQPEGKPPADSPRRPSDRGEDGLSAWGQIILGGRQRSWTLLLVPALVVYVLLLLVPLGMMISLTVDEGWTGIVNVVTFPIFRSVVVTTVVISVLTTLFATVAAYFASLAIWRSRSVSIKGFLIALVLVPFWTGVLVKNFAWAVLLQDNGFVNMTLMNLRLINEPLTLLHNRLAVVIGMVHYVLPYAVLPMVAAMMSIDRRLERAAQSLGASSWRTWLHVTFPLSLPGVFASALLVFILSTGFFITPVVLGSPREMMVANLIEHYTNRLTDLNSASILATLVTIAVAALVIVYQRLPKEGQYGA